MSTLIGAMNTMHDTHNRGWFTLTHKQKLSNEQARLAREQAKMGLDTPQVVTDAISQAMAKTILIAGAVATGILIIGFTIGRVSKSCVGS